MVPTPDFWLRLKVDFFRSKWFIADLLQNSQPRARLLRGGSETVDLSDTWAPGWVSKALSLQLCRAGWAQLESPSGCHCSVGAAVGDSGCDPCQQHRGTCQIHSTVHFTGLQAIVRFLSR